MNMTPLEINSWRGKFLPQTQSRTPSATYNYTAAQSVWGAWVSYSYAYDHLYNGNPYAGKMVSLYWIDPLIPDI